MSLEEVAQLANTYNCDVIYLGCDAALDASVGAKGVIKKLSALHRLEESVDAATTIGQLLRNLVSEELTLVLDRKAFEHCRVYNFAAHVKKTTGTANVVEFTDASSASVLGLIVTYRLGIAMRNDEWAAEKGNQWFWILGYSSLALAGGIVTVLLCRKRWRQQ